MIPSGRFRKVPVDQEQPNMQFNTDSSNSSQDNVNINININPMMRTATEGDGVPREGAVGATAGGASASVNQQESKTNMEPAFPLNKDEEYIKATTFRKRGDIEKSASSSSSSSTPDKIDNKNKNKKTPTGKSTGLETGANTGKRSPKVGSSKTKKRNLPSSAAAAPEGVGISSPKRSRTAAAADDSDNDEDDHSDDRDGSQQHLRGRIAGGLLVGPLSPAARDAPLSRGPASPGTSNALAGGTGTAGLALALPQSFLHHPHQQLQQQSLMMDIGGSTRGNDLVDANAALRRDLVALQQQQFRQQQMQQQQVLPAHVNPSFQELQQFIQGQQQQALTGQSSQQQQQQQQQLQLQQHAPWMNNADLLLRQGAGIGGNNANMMMEGGVGRLNLLRQQQERLLQLELFEEEAAMRRQFQLLRGGSSNMGMGMNVNMGMNMNMNRNQMGMNRGMDMGMGGIMNNSFQPTATSSGAFSGLTPSSNANDALSLHETFLLQQQLHQQPQQGIFSHLTWQQQQQQRELLSQQQQQQSSSNLDMPSNPVPRETSQSMNNQVLVTGGASSRREPASSRPTRLPRSPRSSSSTTLPSSMARATPMVGPIAPPVPAPPPHLLSGQTNYQLPPIEEDETPHYSNRVHVPLAIEEDQNWLSEFQCFVRQELLQVFRASRQDVKIRVASKKVFYKQVGIRCRFCAHCKPSTRAIRSSAFPSSIRQLYQSFTMMLRDHFGNCESIPKDLKDRFLDLKRNNTTGASDSMRYWIYSAVKLGMVDSDNGIILNEETQEAARNKPPFGTTPRDEGVTSPGGATPGQSVDHPPRLLVKPEDLENNEISSEFLYSLLTQYQLIRLLPTECIGNRKSLRPGVPGLGCRYCCQAGRLGLARIFPAKKKQLPTQIQDLYDHIRRCNLCPTAVREKLQELKRDRDRQRLSASSTASASGSDTKEAERNLRIVDDSDKGFLDLLWQRLGHKGELATPTV